MKTLKLLAVDKYNISPTSDGTFNVSHGAAKQVVGKVYNQMSKSWQAVGVVEMACLNNLSLNYYLSRLREGSLLPGDQETANLAGLPFTQ